MRCYIHYRIQEASFIEMAELLAGLLQNASLPDDTKKLQTQLPLNRKHYHPADRHLLALHWNNSLYIDTCLPCTCLPFDLHSTSKLCNIFGGLTNMDVDRVGVA